MKKITLVLGGIRSGKSHFAEQQALYYSQRPVYIATAVPFDQETIARIDLHRERRQDQFDVFEEPTDLVKVLAELHNRTVLVDCMTLNLSNRLLAEAEDAPLSRLIAEGDDYLAHIHDTIERNRLNVIFVSNEVGLAPVAANRLGRYFQDLQGRWNRVLASYADEAHLIQAGIPTLLKKEKRFPFKLSAPSYLYPGGYIENITRTMETVDDIQLLLFDSVADDPLFQAETLSTLHYLQQGAGITYSVHMPTAPKVFDAFETRVAGSLSIIETLSRLDISSFTFHYDLPEQTVWEELSPEAIQAIDHTYIDFFSAIRRQFPGIDISLENTATPLSALDNVVTRCRISYCADIGHLIIQQRDIDEIRPRLPRASIVHFHGVHTVNGAPRDHQPIQYHRAIFQTLEDFHGVLTIENYHPTLFHRSRAQLERYF